MGLRSYGAACDVWGHSTQGATTVQSTREELDQLAEKTQAWEEEQKRFNGKPRPKRTGNVFYIRPPVKRVKGFDASAQKAERRKLARAKQHTKRLKAKPPAVC